jgi:hypothetical protein
MQVGTFLWLAPIWVRLARMQVFIHGLSDASTATGGGTSSLWRIRCTRSNWGCARMSDCTGDPPHFA